MSGFGLGLGMGFSRGGAAPWIPSLDFTTGTLDSHVTASGGTNGTRVNSSGNVVSATAPRFNYNPVSHASKGILVEPSGTNTGTRSEALPNAAWLKSGVTVTADAGVAPSGATTAELVVPTAATTYHQVGHITGAVSAGVTAAASIFVKASGLTTICLTDWNTATLYYTFDLVALTATLNGADANLSLSAPVIEDYGNGWYRISATFAAIGTSKIPCWCPGSTPFSTGDGVNGCYLWGAQVEMNKSAAGSYITTTASAVTRTADSLSFTIPAGVATLRYTFDDDTTQDVSVSAGPYTIPTNLNRPNIKSIASV